MDKFFFALAPQHQQRIKPKFKTISTVMRWNGIQAKEKICYILMHSIIMQMLDYSHFSKALASISVGQFLFLQVHVHVFFSYVLDKCYQKDFYFIFFVYHLFRTRARIRMDVTEQWLLLLLLVESCSQEWHASFMVNKAVY